MNCPIRAAITLLAFEAAELIVRTIIYRQFFKRESIMKLAPNWRAVVRLSWSFWGNILLAIAMGIAGGFSIDGTFYWSMALANFAVAVLRLIFQKGLSDAD